MAIYGKGWEEVPACAPYARGELPYEELALLYPSVKLVLDDTQGPTLPYGAVNARVFDALAAGTLVITNCESGVRELFDEEFPVWSSRESLARGSTSCSRDERRRGALAARYREVVLARHTYAHRAARLRELLVEHEQRLTFCLKIGAPDRAVAPRWGDLHFAEAIARELRRRGHRALVQTLDEWEDEAGLSYDVVVHLKGLCALSPQARPVQRAVVDQPPGRADRRGVRRLRSRGGGLARVRGAAERSGPRRRWSCSSRRPTRGSCIRTPARQLAHELVYVANSRNVLRPIARDLLPTERDLAIWGANWEGLIDTSRVIAEHVPNSALRHVYSSAGDRAERPLG